MNSSENFSGQSRSMDDVSTVVSSFVTDSSTIDFQKATSEEQFNAFDSSDFLVKGTDVLEEEIEDSYQWAILAGGFLAQAISIMQDYYNREVFKGSVDSTSLSFVGTLGMSFCGLMGPVTPILMSLIGSRCLLFLSTILLASGLVLASFADQIWQLYLTQSIMHGTGAALLYIVSMSISPQWFIKKRAFAMGVMVSGSGLGGLIMPFVMTHLNESLGGAWCYRVLGVVSFIASSIAAILLKENPNSGSKKEKKNLSNVIDTSVCRDILFIIWCVSGNLSMMGYFIPAFYLPSHATKLGLSPSQGSILVAAFSAVNVLGRIISGYLGDHVGVLNVNTMFLLVCGLSSLLIWTIADSFVTLLVFILIYGFMSGSVFSLLASITASITGMEKYPSGVCLYLFFMTASRFGPSLAGAIQNATDKDSYFPQQLFTGVSFILSAITTFFLKYKMNSDLLAKI